MSELIEFHSIQSQVIKTRFKQNARGGHRFEVDRIPLDPGPSDQNALPISTISSPTFTASGLDG